MRSEDDDDDGKEKPVKIISHSLACDLLNILRDSITRGKSEDNIYVNVIITVEDNNVRAHLVTCIHPHVIRVSLVLPVFSCSRMSLIYYQEIIVWWRRARPFFIMIREREEIKSFHMTRFAHIFSHKCAEILVNKIFHFQANKPRISINISREHDFNSLSFFCCLFLFSHSFTNFERLLWS
jgi:hypothetical protein